MTTKVKIIECASFDEASIRGTKEAGNSSGTVLPVVIFRQGSRQVLAGAMAVRQITKYVFLENKSKKGDKPEEVVSNKTRPIIPEHVDTIRKYLIQNAGRPNGDPNKGKYILPGLTFNVKEEIRVYTGPGSSTIKMGYLVLPDVAALESTDGQHRVLALPGALEKMMERDREYFGQDAIPFMLTCEDDPKQIHQDFADCSKTKPIPPSLLTSYDRRLRGNGLVLDLIDACPVFRDKVDGTSKNLSKNALKLFLTNQVRQLVRALLTGDVAMAEAPFAAKASELLPEGREDIYQDALKRYTDFINVVTEHLPLCRDAAQIHRGLDMNKITS